jgi:hypothetical protein
MNHEARNMGLKPDHWIRKMAIKKKMIDPFKPE